LRYKKIEEKSVAAITFGISHRSLEVGKKISSQRVKIKCPLESVLGSNIC
jgi:hypothetical protein